MTFDSQRRIHVQTLHELLGSGHNEQKTAKGEVDDIRADGDKGGRQKDQETNNKPACSSLPGWIQYACQ